MTSALFFLIISFILLIIFVWLTGRRLSRTDWGINWVSWFAGWNRFYCRWFHGFKGEKINLPDGPLLVISNHISALDPLIMSAACERPLRFLVAKEEYQKTVFNWLLKDAGCIPVDRGGRVEKAFRDAIRQLEKGEVIALFPHGGMHKDSDPHKPLKRGAFKLAEMMNCPIIPVRLTGIRYPGSTVRSLLLPGRVKLKVLHTIPAGMHLSQQQREHLGEVLVGKAEDKNWTLLNQQNAVDLQMDSNNDE
jgi:1-acyl-sn-glycerol-3-phosphate acyltransferase